MSALPGTAMGRRTIRVDPDWYHRRMRVTLPTREWLVRPHPTPHGPRPRLRRRTWLEPWILRPTDPVAAPIGTVQSPYGRPGIFVVLGGEEFKLPGRWDPPTFAWGGHSFEFVQKRRCLVSRGVTLARFRPRGLIGLGIEAECFAPEYDDLIGAIAAGRVLEQLLQLRGP